MISRGCLKKIFVKKLQKLIEVNDNPTYQNTTIRVKKEVNSIGFPHYSEMEHSYEVFVELKGIKQ